jgi:hypothetical protein
MTVNPPEGTLRDKAVQRRLSFNIPERHLSKSGYVRKGHFAASRRPFKQHSPNLTPHPDQPPAHRNPLP